MSEEIDTKKLRKIAGRSTRVVGWYAHMTTVRGPYCRWFKCSEVDDQDKHRVASTTDECEFAAAAMNNFVPLLDEIDRLRTEREDWLADKQIRDWIAVEEDT